MNYLVELQKQFEQHKNNEQAKPMAAYMKNKFQYLGIKAPERKELLRSFIKQHGKPARAIIEDVVIGLWSLPQREFQYVAMELSEKALKNPQEEDILIVEYMLEYKQWWDTIDFLASHHVGNIFKSFANIKTQYFHKWTKSSNMWLNRTAILFQLSYKQNTDTDLLKAAILPHLGSSEFFHQKAIGWALRQYAKVNKEWVSDFISDHTLKPLSLREATKNF